MSHAATMASGLIELMEKDGTFQAASWDHKPYGKWIRHLEGGPDVAVIIRYPKEGESDAERAVWIFGAGGRPA